MFNPGVPASCTCGCRPWLPLTIDAHVNGRELAGAAAHARRGSLTRRAVYCFTAIADFARVQRASDELTILTGPLCFIRAGAARHARVISRWSGSGNRRQPLREPYAAKRGCDRRRLWRLLLIL